MNRLYYTCPKCGHKLAPPQPASSQCPACGVYFFKWENRLERPPAVPDEEPGLLSGMALPEYGSLLAPKPAMHPAAFYGRVALFALLLIWSWKLYRHDYRAAFPEFDAWYGFFHRIVLPIHEAGHVFLIPFGEFMTIIGGSLFQIALPLGIGIAFIIKNRDNFGAAVCGWWTGGSVIDVAEYIYDAQDPRLIMLGGHTGNDGPHDWIWLLGNQTHHAHAIGILVHTLGGLLMLAALIWGGIVLWRQREKLGDGLEDDLPL